MGLPSTEPEAANNLEYETPRVRKYNRYSPAQYQRRSSDEIQQTRNHQNRGSSLCSGCGGPHMRNQCRFRDARCNTCNKKGHLAKVCRSGRSRLYNSSTDQVESSEHPASEIDVVQTVGQIHDVNGTEKKK